MSPECCFERFFDQNPAVRLKYLTMMGSHAEVPIAFPWEIIGEDGTFRTKTSFALRDEPYNHGTNCRTGGRSATDPDVYDIFTAIWQRAREEVQAATKISFVGLSLHEYLNFGFEYLFKGKAGGIKLVVTDHNSRQNFGKEALGSDLSPLSAGAKALKILQKYCPSTTPNHGLQVTLERGGSKRSHRSSGDAVRLRLNFEEFINEELGPT
jgi:hypothetical protein